MKKEFIGCTADGKLFVALSMDCTLPFELVFGFIRDTAPCIHCSASNTTGISYTLQLRYMSDSKTLSYAVINIMNALLRNIASSIIDVEHIRTASLSQNKHIAADLLGTQNAEEESRTQSSKKFPDEGQIGKYPEEIMVKRS